MENDASKPGYDLSEENVVMQNDSSELDDEDEQVNIDDGLLDAVFNELPGTGNIRPPKPTPPPCTTYLEFDSQSR